MMRENLDVGSMMDIVLSGKGPEFPQFRGESGKAAIAKLSAFKSASHPIPFLKSLSASCRTNFGRQSPNVGRSPVPGDDQPKTPTNGQNSWPLFNSIAELLGTMQNA